MGVVSQIERRHKNPALSLQKAERQRQGTLEVVWKRPGQPPDQFDGVEFSPQAI
jgi:hypothetical protein